MDWTAGYASDVEYTAGFYREQGPAYLNFACVLNGYEPVALNRPFTCFELGFGRGLTANVLAASNPQGQFYAADFNPAHVAGARQVATNAQLSNLVLLENSFAELAAGQVSDLPQFDFITLHGIYTWVTVENRAHIVNFIARYLKPGGIVYLSYNAMPGWSAAVPLQRLLVEHGELFPNRSDVQLRQAAAFVEKMEAAQAGYLTASPSLKQRLEMLKTGNTHYLVHEYMHRHWEPLYHIDVARDLSAAKLDYVGSADLAFAYPSLYLNAERQALLNEIPDAPLRETFKDYLLNTAFRKDVFVRGARKMSTARQTECLQQFGLALVVPRGDATLKLKLPFGEVGGKDEVYGPVLDALAKMPHSLSELAALPALKGQSLSTLGQVATLLTASNQTAIYFSGAKVIVDGAHKMNRSLAGQTRYGDEFHVLASPLLGSGVSANFIERLVYLVVVQQPKEQDVSVITRQVWQFMASQGRRMLKEGKAIESEKDNITELSGQIKAILEARLPVWRQLKLL
jgi:SAM-dependent methyltransferase